MMTTLLGRLRRVSARALEKAEDWCAFREVYFPRSDWRRDQDVGPGGVDRAEADRRARRWFELHTRAERRIHQFVPPEPMGSRP